LSSFWVDLSWFSSFPSLDHCGEEVTPDYPHEEAKRPGINHFPEGVFQKCRRLLQKEKEAELALVRKQKRRRNGGGSGRNTNVVVPVTGGDDYANDDDNESVGGRMNGGGGGGGDLWDDVMTEASTPFDPNNRSPFPTNFIAPPPSTPSVIHFPLMEEDEFILPTSSSIAADPSSILHLNDRLSIITPSGLMNSILNSPQQTRNRSPTTSISQFPSSPVSDSPVFNSNRTAGNTIVSSPPLTDVTRTFESFDEEWSTAIQRSSLGNRGHAFTTHNTPISTPVGSPQRTTRERPNRNQQQPPPQQQRVTPNSSPSRPIRLHQRGLPSDATAAAVGAPAMNSHSVSSSPVITRHNRARTSESRQRNGGRNHERNNDTTLG
jgi:hypothetical protein